MVRLAIIIYGFQKNAGRLSGMSRGMQRGRCTYNGLPVRSLGGTVSHRISRSKERKIVLFSTNDTARRRTSYAPKYRLCNLLTHNVLQKWPIYASKVGHLRVVNGLVTGQKWATYDSQMA